jgi:flavin reductase
MVECDIFRAAMARLGAAVNIVATDGPAGRYGMTASAVCSVTDTPPTLLVCINRASTANRFLKVNGVLCVNVLAGRHKALSQRFARRASSMAERFGDDADWRTLTTGSPALADASVALDCRVTAVEEVGTHSVFFCEVADALFHDDAEGLIYFDRAYHMVTTARPTEVRT